MSWYVWHVYCYAGLQIDGFLLEEYDTNLIEYLVCNMCKLCCYTASEMEEGGIHVRLMYYVRTIYPKN